MNATMTRFIFVSMLALCGAVGGAMRPTPEYLKRSTVYYSVRSYDEEHLPKGMPKRRLKTWCGSVAESKGLVNWKRIGDINVKAATELAEIGILSSEGEK